MPETSQNLPKFFLTPRGARGAAGGPFFPKSAFLVFLLIFLQTWAERHLPIFRICVERGKKEFHLLWTTFLFPLEARGPGLGARGGQGPEDIESDQKFQLEPGQNPIGSWVETSVYLIICTRLLHDLYLALIFKKELCHGFWLLF